MCIMESKVESLEVPLFRPSLEQFANFGNFIKFLETLDISYAKVIPPPEWKPMTKHIPNDFVLENVYSQRHEKLQHGGYEIVNTKVEPMTYSHYVQLATANESELNEDKFWENVASKSSSNLYSIDNNISLFGDEVMLWNLSKLTKTHSNIHGTNAGKNIAEGIQKPFSYIGVQSACFGAHIEDGNLNSVNLLHRGKPKLWYFIRSDQNKKFERLTKKMAKLIDCDLYVRHKTILPPPSVLNKEKIEFARVLQNAGEIIISFSGGYHFGFSLGFNEAESVNFGSERWLRFFDDFKICSCSHSGDEQCINLNWLSGIVDDIRSQFPCEICGTKYSSEPALKMHNSLTHAPKLNHFQCGSCKKSFTTPYNLKIHMKDIHGVDGNLKTVKAMKKTTNNRKKVKPKENKTAKYRKLLTCIVCGQTAHGTGNMNRHMRRHPGVTTEKETETNREDVTDEHSQGNETTQNVVQGLANKPPTKTPAKRKRPTKHIQETHMGNSSAGVKRKSTTQTSMPEKETETNREDVTDEHSQGNETTQNVVQSLANEPSTKTPAKRKRSAKHIQETHLGNSSAGVKRKSTTQTSMPEKETEIDGHSQGNAMSKNEDENSQLVANLDKPAKYRIPLKNRKLDKQMKEVEMFEPPRMQIGSLGKIPKISRSVPSFGKLDMENLLTYKIPINIRNIEFNGDISAFNILESFMDQARLNQASYISAFTAMIYLEEASESKRISKFNIEKVGLSLQSSKDKIFKIGYDENFPNYLNAWNESLLDGLIIESIGMPDDVFSARMCGCDTDFIYIKITEGFDDLNNRYNKELFSISFHINRLPFQLQHNALRWIGEHNLFDKLISYPSFWTEQPSVDNYQLSCELAKSLNENQQKAVENIVLAQNRPIPFLLYGPPGTGKTRTLVAAIEEIVRTTESYVLVSAGSNSACDEITERLLNVLRDDELFRMYAKSFNKKKLSSKIRPVCNFIEGEFKFPSLEYLYKYRVVICTLLTAGSLTRARRLDPNFDSNHFSLIIIDEGGFVQEPVSLIPIAGLCSENGAIKCGIVIAGDPNQLDAVVKSEYAEQLNYNTSYMEFLMKQDCYQKMDSKGIVQLTDNYRNHPAILNPVSKLFYKGTLQSKASTDVTRFIGSSFLPNKEFPIIFESVEGVCEKSSDFSSFNKAEVTVVMQYIKEIARKKWNDKLVSPSDIGVISPYRAQCDEIRKECQFFGYDEVTIGTVETYQGQERPVIILSMVRSAGNITDFVIDSKRLNVMISRASCLLIIIGDCNTLNMEDNWKKIINYCSLNGALKQGNKILHPRV